MIERTTDPMSEQTRAAIQRFHEAFNTHDIDALAGCITDDCLFEDTTPPDGGRHVGIVEGGRAVPILCVPDAAVSVPAVFFRFAAQPLLVAVAPVPALALPAVPDFAAPFLVPMIP